MKEKQRERKQEEIKAEDGELRICALKVRECVVELGILRG